VGVLVLLHCEFPWRSESSWSYLHCRYIIILGVTMDGANGGSCSLATLRVSFEVSKWLFLCAILCPSSCGSS